MEINVEQVSGDIVEISADALVNPWNRNFIPRWLLVPGGVSGALKRKTGPTPWRELARHGTLELGQAVTTSAGDLANVQAIIHVAGLTAGWIATGRSVELSVMNPSSRHGLTDSGRSPFPSSGPAMEGWGKTQRAS